MRSHHLDKYMPQAISGVSNKLRFRKAATVLDQREAERVPLRTYVSYMTDGGKGYLVAKGGSLICPRRDAKSRGQH